MVVALVVAAFVREAVVLVVEAAIVKVVVVVMG